MKPTKLLLAILLFLSGSGLLSAQNNWLTDYEISQGRKTPTYKQTIEFCQKLAKASKEIHFQFIGKSHQGLDIPLLIYDSKGIFEPQKAKQQGRLVVMIQAGIHAGEPVGKDAGLILFRDIAINNKYKEYLSNTTIVFLPILNVDGHERFGPYNRINQNGPEEMGWRTNALNLNLNRDYLKADALETRHFLKLFNAWMPDFFIDCHSTNGGDYQYPLTYALETLGNQDKNLTQWMEKSYLAPIESKMEQQGHPIFPYVTYRSWHNPTSGLISRPSHPMLSTGYVSERNRPALLIETHMLKPYNIRVESCLAMIVNSLQILNKEQKNLQQIIRNAEQHTASPKFREQAFPLRFEVTNDSVMTEFKGVEFDILKSDLTGGDWYIYYPDKPKNYQIPHFFQLKPAYEVNLPYAYIIPPQWSDIIERLELHGIKTIRTSKTLSIETENYTFSEVSFPPTSNEGRHNPRFKIQTQTSTTTYPAGSAIIMMSQPQARLIAHALEPMAPGSFVYWGFFNAIFERKEYFETYTMETMAREMIANNPALLKEFEEYKNANPQLKGNQYGLLNWFYERTPYLDQMHNLYPIGRIMNELNLREL